MTSAWSPLSAVASAGIALSLFSGGYSPSALAAPGPAIRAKAVIRAADGAVRGAILVSEQSGSGLLEARIDVIGVVNGLAPGQSYGLHLRHGTCAAPGDHVDFTGLLDPAQTHPRDEGDLPNVTAGANGRLNIRLNRATNRFTLRDDALLNLFYRAGGPVVVAIDATPATATAFAAAPILCGELHCESGACSEVPGPPPVPPAQGLISQIYGGGGNSGASWTNDFVELRNPSSAPLDISGYTLQYSSQSSASWTIIWGAPPASIIPAGGFFLVQFASQAAVGAPLPTPDGMPVSSPQNLAAGAAKVALVRDATNLGLAGSCAAVLATPALLDLVGYGAHTVPCFEGAAAATGPSNNTRSVVRTLAPPASPSSCTDTNQNGADLAILTPPVPRNSASPATACP